MSDLKYLGEQFGILRKIPSIGMDKWIVRTQSTKGSSAFHFKMLVRLFIGTLCTGCASCHALAQANILSETQHAYFLKHEIKEGISTTTRRYFTPETVATPKKTHVATAFIANPNLSLTHRKIETILLLGEGTAKKKGRVTLSCLPVAPVVASTLQCICRPTIRT